VVPQLALGLIAQRSALANVHTYWQSRSESLGRWKQEWSAARLGKYQVTPSSIRCELAILVAFYLRVKSGVDNTEFIPSTMETFDY
jgi:hypothetical protein